MDKTVQCPACNANLTLPSVPEGESVQCPRCRHVFAFLRPRTGAPDAPVFRSEAAEVPAATAHADDVAPVYDPRSLHSAMTAGRRKAWLAIALLALHIPSFCVLIELAFERVELVRLDHDLNGQPGLFVPRPGAMNHNLRREELRLLQEELRLRQEELRRRWAVWEQYWSTAGLVHAGISLAAFVSCLIWLNQASRNLWFLQADGLSHNPWQAVVCFFVPIVNLFRPYGIGQEIWRASHPRALENPHSWTETPRALSVKLWWAFSVAAVLLLGIFLLQEPSPPDFPLADDDPMPATVVGTLCCICVMIAEAFLIYVIYKITERQTGRFARLYEDPA